MNAEDQVMLCPKNPLGGFLTARGAISKTSYAAAKDVPSVHNIADSADAIIALAATRVRGNARAPLTRQSTQWTNLGNHPTASLEKSLACVATPGALTADVVVNQAGTNQQTQKGVLPCYRRPFPQ